MPVSLGNSKKLCICELGFHVDVILGCILHVQSKLTIMKCENL